MRWLAFSVLALLGACSGKSPADPNRPESYALSIAVEPGPGGPEQRIALPAAVLLSLQNPSQSDIRLFDATGRALPLAIAAPRGGATVEIPVPVYPVVSASPASAGQLALTIGADGVARAAALRGEAGPERSAAVVLDTRRIEEPATGLAIAIDYPAKALVSLRIAASSDLARWDELTKQTLLRAQGEGTPDAARIALDDVLLQDRYLRISWGETDKVAVTDAKVLVRGAEAPPQEVVQTTGVKMATPHRIDLSLPGGAVPAALRLRLGGEEGVVPLRLAQRATAESAWVPAAAATLRGSMPATLPLDPAAGRSVRIEADARTPGFAAPPRIELVYRADELLTRFSGKPPYRLVAGLANAPAALLDRRDLIASADAARLPAATIEANPPPPVSLAVKESGGRFDRRWALWAVLLAATAVLAFVVWRLARANGASKA